jgi:Golgi phosphoprotein 3
MGEDNGLFLHEEILLLALKDEEGTITPGTMYQYALGGAVLAELLLRRRIGLMEHGKTKLVETTDPKPVGNCLIDECLSRITTAKRRASLGTWVSRVAQSKDLTHRIARQLCRRGILRADEEKILLIFTRKIYPEVDPKPERQLISRLYQAIFTDTPHVDPGTIVLVSLANSAGILDVLFDRKALRQRKERIQQLVHGEIVGKATKEAIEAMEAASTVACVMPMIMSSFDLGTHSG